MSQHCSEKTALRIYKRSVVCSCCLTDELCPPFVLVANPTQEGETPLHLVAQWHNLALITALLEAGADVNAESTEGGTPVAQALADSWGRTDDPENAVGILLAWGACPVPLSF